MKSDKLLFWFFLISDIRSSRHLVHTTCHGNQVWKHCCWRALFCLHASSLQSVCQFRRWRCTHLSTLLTDGSIHVWILALAPRATWLSVCAWSNERAYIETDTETTSVTPPTPKLRDRRTRLFLLSFRPYLRWFGFFFYCSACLCNYCRLNVHKMLWHKAVIYNIAHKSERKCAENYNKWHHKFIFLTAISIFLITGCAVAPALC